MSDTEREALEAGDVWWDAELFTGNPDWAKLLATAPATLTAEEQAFPRRPGRGALRDARRLEDQLGTCATCRREVWEFIKREKFFGMIIPKEYGGLGFSPYAHSEVVRKISTRSLAAAVTVMVPNSLGPGELLMHYGTEEQKQQLAAAPRRRARNSVLRADQPGSRLRRGVDARLRHRLQGQVRGPRGARPARHLGQALHHARPGRDAARPRLQGLRPRSSARRRRKTSASPWR